MCFSQFVGNPFQQQKAYFTNYSPLMHQVLFCFCSTRSSLIKEIIESTFMTRQTDSYDTILTLKRFMVLLPFFWRMCQFKFLSHIGYSHVQVQPVNLLRLQMTESQPIAGHIFHFVTVHNLLYYALKQRNTLLNSQKMQYVFVNTLILQ